VAPVKGGWAALAKLIGPELAAKVSAALHGSRVRIGKRTGTLAAAYAERAEEYDKMSAAGVAALLGCRVRRVHGIRAERRIIVEKEAENSQPRTGNIP